MTRNKGILYLALCAALWSTAGVFIKLIDWNSLVIGGFRSAIAAAVLWIVLWRRGAPRPVWNRSTLLTGLCLGGTTALFVMANKLTTATTVRSRRVIRCPRPIAQNSRTKTGLAD